MEHIELLPAREALLFDFVKYAKVNAFSSANQYNEAGALLGALILQGGAASSANAVQIVQ